MTATEKTYRAGTFRFGDGGQVVEGITDGTTWNGAANVYVTRETLQDLSEDIETALWQNGMNATITVSDDGSDARIVYDDASDVPDEADDVLPVVVHDGTTFYGLVDGWTWIDMGNRSVVCKTCNGEGYVVSSPVHETSCKGCEGWGYVDPEVIPCDRCGGWGFTTVNGSDVSCPRCNGWGFVDPEEVQG